MEKIGTNRDLYVAITEPLEERKETQRSLEEYLSALWKLGSERKQESQFSVECFFGSLVSAFESTAPEFDESWRDRYARDVEKDVGFSAWESTILRQIVDLREMKETGTLEKEMRYFGVSSPRGGYWYNFDPCSFLECATAGSSGGWQPGDSTGRDFVPGEVAVMNEEGEIETRDPRDIDDPIFEMPQVTWEFFQDFLWCGQNYE